MFLRFLVGNWFAGGGVEHGYAPEVNLEDRLSGSGGSGILRDDEDGLRRDRGLGGEARPVNVCRWSGRIESALYDEGKDLRVH